MLEWGSVSPLQRFPVCSLRSDRTQFQAILVIFTFKKAINVGGVLGSSIWQISIAAFTYVVCGHGVFLIFPLKFLIIRCIFTKEINCLYRQTFLIDILYHAYMYTIICVFAIYVLCLLSSFAWHHAFQELQIILILSFVHFFYLS